jgi:D-serine deaminase-like pyridoxal phosphate-dependent protein
MLLRRQVAAGGCIGVTCATPDEALVLANSGFEDILVANEIADDHRIDQLLVAADNARVSIAVDSARHVEQLTSRAAANGQELGILIEIDVGHHRCGISPDGGALLAIAEAVTRAPNLNLLGIMGYEGHAALDQDPSSRRQKVLAASQILGTHRRRLEAAGYPCAIVSGGATGTFDMVSQIGVLTEAQIGSYVLLDATYERLDLGYTPALACLARVISRRSPSEAVLNAGLKAISGEQGPPKSAFDGVEVVSLHDEHAIARVSPSATISIGDVIPLIPAHVDPTMNLHDAVFAWHPGGRIDTWPVDGRRSVAVEAALPTPPSRFRPDQAPLRDRKRRRPRGRPAR